MYEDNDGAQSDVCDYFHHPVYQAKHDSVLSSEPDQRIDLREEHCQFVIIGIRPCEYDGGDRATSLKAGDRV